MSYVCKDCRHPKTKSEMQRHSSGSIMDYCKKCMSIRRTRGLGKRGKKPSMQAVNAALTATDEGSNGIGKMVSALVAAFGQKGTTIKSLHFVYRTDEVGGLVLDKVEAETSQHETIHP